MEQKKNPSYYFVLELIAISFFILAVGVAPIILGIIFYDGTGINYYLFLILLGILGIVVGFLKLKNIIKNKA